MTDQPESSGSHSTRATCPSDAEVATRHAVLERAESLSNRSGPWELIDGGLSTVVVGTDEIVWRVPLNGEAAAAQERLSVLLPLLAPHLPTPIPAPLRLLPATDGLPFGALVLQRLPGQPLAGSCVSGTIAEALATFLATLHGLPTTLAPPSLLAHHGSDDADRDIREAALPTFMAAFPQEARTAMAWWEAYLGEGRRREFPPVIVHGDCWHENILVDPSGVRLTGILDWENCGIGDPAMDLAALWHANKTLFTIVLGRYSRLTGSEPAALRQRARWQFERREWAGLAWAVRLNVKRELPDALAKVHAVLAGAADGM